jgi:transketolase
MNIDPELIRKLEIRATILRRHIIRMVGAGKTGHIGGSCSAADLVAALYFSELNIDPANPKEPGRDRFLLSKGHAALVQYAALAERGFFPLEELDRVKTIGSILQGHPDLTKTPGVEANTGSLGQGLSIANGMALAARLDGLDCWFYVILGDGELNEGQVWEAAMFGAFQRLDHVIAILDKNGLQAMGCIKDRLDTDPMAEKWRGFGWDVQEIDGHDMRQILAGLRLAKQAQGRPHILIARTIKGKGVPFAENNPAFHNGIMTQEQHQLALQLFGARLNELEGRHE